MTRDTEMPGVWPDTLTAPIMEKHGVTHDEACKRLEMLFKSGIVDNGHPDNPDDQQMIEDFLAMTSEEALEKGRFAEVFEHCISNKELVWNYDRLAKRNLTRVLYQIGIGKAPKDWHREYTLFSEFVRETIYNRMDFSESASSLSSPTNEAK